MSVIEKNIVGLKLSIPPRLCGDQDFKSFLGKITAEMEGVNFNLPFQELECKYYEEETGDLYLHFSRPVIPGGILEEFFDNDELIYELEKIED